MRMILPPYLRKGDTIGITCPASKMDREAAEYACGVLSSWGFNVVVGKTIGSHYNNFSAPDTTRLQELQQMLDDDHIHAILFGRGGYGLTRILDQVDFSHFKKHPKWICGYSDITALHVHIQQHFHIATIHSLMCSGITPETKEDEYVKSLLKALTGERIDYSFKNRPLNREGIARGILTGGNLSLLTSLSGTPSQPDTKGKILFIEEVGEYRYNVDRMMINLQRAGWLSSLSGLLIGAFTEGKETDTPFGQTEDEIIWDKVRSCDFPVAFGFPAGHQKENYTLKLGAEYLLHVDKGNCRLEECDFLS